MTQIILNDEQAKVFTDVRQLVQVCDGQGNVLGTLSPIWTNEDIVQAEKILASDGPWRTTEQVLARLRSLEQP